MSQYALYLLEAQMQNSKCLISPKMDWSKEGGKDEIVFAKLLNMNFSDL